MQQSKPIAPKSVGQGAALQPPGRNTGQMWGSRAFSPNMWVHMNFNVPQHQLSCSPGGTPFAPRQVGPAQNPTILAVANTVEKPSVPPPPQVKEYCRRFIHNNI